MEGMKLDRTIAEESKLLSIQKNAKEIADKYGVTMAEATKQATLNALKRKKSSKAGKGKKGKKAKKGSKAKKGGSMLDYVLGR